MPRPTDIADITYSLLVLNVNFRTTADDLFPLFDKYGKVMDIFIPRDRRTGESRGFAFVRYMYKDEAQKAVDKLDGRVVDGRDIAVQFAKYGPHAERIHDGRIVEKLTRRRGRSRSTSPWRRSQDGYHEDRDYRRRYRSRSMHRYEHRRDYWHRSRSYSGSPDYDRGRGRRRYDDERRSRSRSFDSYDRERNDGPGGQMMWLLVLFVTSRCMIVTLMLIVDLENSLKYSVFGISFWSSPTRLHILGLNEYGGPLAFLFGLLGGGRSGRLIGSRPDPTRSGAGNESGFDVG
ncbi:UNVERIFIED_CONTAM: Serine/arginine-rich splicing factor SC35 [Sesamum radiatum]|uniref:Serine/arginine-rich splicing factor SC35 n=1 Tax=Sesamum radiatum TaxID=300843 RepID=A0AAW2RYB4_SESRA